MDVSFSSRRTRSRSRSRSRSVRTRGTRVPRFRALYSGDCKFTRSCQMALSTSAGLGFAVVAANYQEVMFTFSPTGVTMWGSNVNYVTFPLPQASEIAGLWDRIKIDKVKLTFTSNVGEAPPTSTATVLHAPMIVIGNDVNGPTSGGATSIDQVLQLSTCKTYTLDGSNKPAVWTIHNPKYQRLIQYTSINSSYEPAIGYVASDTDIPHYGVRVGLLNSTDLVACRIIATAKFYFSAKNVK